MPGETTTVSIRKEVHEALKQLGAKDESFNQIIARLLDFYNQHKATAIQR